MSLFPISESDDFVVHYDPVSKQYRVIVFKDGHFLDEFWFDEYKEEDYSMQKALNARYSAENFAKVVPPIKYEDLIKSIERLRKDIGWGL